MVNTMVSDGQVRRREIGEPDLGAIADLLVRGFPGRRREYWAGGLRRMTERPSPPAGSPRYGYMLEAAGGPVGVVLLLFDDGIARGEPGPRCNLSSWYVEPAFRMHAPLLVASALRRRDVTYTNVTPAPHTWATIEAQGFIAYAIGQVLVAPALSRIREPARVLDFAAGPRRDIPEAALLADHAGYGCRSLVVEAPSGTYPFVFLPLRVRAGRLPTPVVQLIFCRDIADLSRFAGVLGRALLRHGIMGMLLDADVPLGGMMPVRRYGGRKYYRGPQRPRLGDLSYTERAILGA